MLKNKSFQKSSPLGNEAATRSFGAGLITHQITGKTYFQAWSFDVKFEGYNIPRHLDITTSNHASYPGNRLTPMPEIERQAGIALAEKRMDAGMCPCCGKEQCPAAFEKGEKALSFEDYYKLNETKAEAGWKKRKNELSPRAEKRMKQLNNMIYRKENECECEGRVFPEPPCDVFREGISKGKYVNIVNVWESKIDDYRNWHLNQYGIELHTESHFIDELIRSHSDSSKMQSIRDSRSSFRRGDPDLKKYSNQISTPASRLERTNHVVPKEAGGCPGHLEEGGDQNLQPQQTLCSVCQGIDQYFTDNWQ